MMHPPGRPPAPCSSPRGVPRIFAALLAVPLAAAACNQSEGSGEISGTLDLPECHGVHGPFEMSLDFFAVDPFGKKGLEVRLQQGGRGMEVADALLLTIYDEDEVLARRGEELPVTSVSLTEKGQGAYAVCAEQATPRPAGCPLLRADLNLVSRCPVDATAPMLDGSAVFTHLGAQDNDRVAGSFQLEARDARTGASVGHLDGRFSFTVHVGVPYQRFPQ